MGKEQRKFFSEAQANIATGTGAAVFSYSIFHMETYGIVIRNEGGICATFHIYEGPTEDPSFLISATNASVNNGVTTAVVRSLSPWSHLRITASATAIVSASNIKFYVEGVDI